MKLKIKLRPNSGLPPALNNSRWYSFPFIPEFNYADCGHCDVCISKRPKDFDSVKKKLIALFDGQSLTLEQLKQKMSGNDQTWIRAFNELIDDEIILMDEDLYTLRR